MGVSGAEMYKSWHLRLLHGAGVADTRAGASLAARAPRRVIESWSPASDLSPALSPRAACPSPGSYPSLSSCTHLSGGRTRGERVRGLSTWWGHPAGITVSSLWDWAWLPIHTSHPLLAAATLGDSTQYKSRVN